MENKELEMLEVPKKAFVKLTITLSIVFAILVSLCVAVFVMSNQEDMLRFTDGSFVLASTDEAFTEFTKSDTSRKFEWYMDTFCGDCIRTHQKTHDYVEKALADGSLEIRFHPLNYLSHYSEEYSGRTAAFLLGIADKGGKKAVLNAMKSLMDKDLREKMKGIKGEQLDNDLSDLFVREGVDKKAVEFARKNVDRYEAIVNKASVNIRRMKKWEDISPKEDKSFFVPFIYEEGKKALDGENEDTEKAVLDPLMGGIDCNAECE